MTWHQWHAAYPTREQDGHVAPPRLGERLRRPTPASRPGCPGAAGGRGRWTSRDGWPCDPPYAAPCGGAHGIQRWSARHTALEPTSPAGSAGAAPVVGPQRDRQGHPVGEHERVASAQVPGPRARRCRTVLTWRYCSRAVAWSEPLLARKERRVAMCSVPRSASESSRGAQQLVDERFEPAGGLLLQQPLQAQQALGPDHPVVTRLGWWPARALRGPGTDPATAGRAGRGCRSRTARPSAAAAAVHRIGHLVSRPVQMPGASPDQRGPKAAGQQAGGPAGPARYDELEPEPSPACSRNGRERCRVEQPLVHEEEQLADALSAQGRLDVALAEGHLERPGRAAPAASHPGARRPVHTSSPRHPAAACWSSTTGPPACAPTPATATVWSSRRSSRRPPRWRRLLEQIGHGCVPAQPGQQARHERFTGPQVWRSRPPPCGWRGTRRWR